MARDLLWSCLLCILLSFLEATAIHPASGTINHPLPNYGVPSLFFTKISNLRLSLQGIIQQHFFSQHEMPTTHKRSISDTDIPVKQYTYPSSLRYKDTVVELVQNVDKNNIYSDVARLSAFRTRYYKSLDGLTSGEWLFERVQRIVAASRGGAGVVEVDKVRHAWSQFSIVVRVPGKQGSSGTSENNVVVLSSHYDSTNLVFPWWFSAPGADDDASAVAALLETLRVVLGSIGETETKRSSFKNTIEFHFYSAEEGEMLGSDEVFASYAKENEQRKKKRVVGMLQLDQIGFSKAGYSVPETGRSSNKDSERDGYNRNKNIGLVTDFTSDNLNKFVKMVIHEVCNVGVVETECGYACSDSASASKYGYPSALIIEGRFTGINKMVHSPLDTIDRLDFDFIEQFSKLAVAYVYELGMFADF